MQSKFLVFIIAVFLSGPVSAQETYLRSHLTTLQIERLKAVKEELAGIDTKTLGTSMRELEKDRRPELHLEMMEAMAHAYTDIAHDYNVDEPKKKQWLYSMVCLNMAYLQFGGDTGKYGSTTELNRLIRKKLKAYLPSDVLNQRGLAYSLS